MWSSEEGTAGVEECPGRMHSFRDPRVPIAETGFAGIGIGAAMAGLRLGSN
jgi:pyruvate/2-oxoglutarate/acetoin dehydrogenase E1 component